MAAGFDDAVATGPWGMGTSTHAGEVVCGRWRRGDQNESGAARRKLCLVSGGVGHSPVANITASSACRQPRMRQCPNRRRALSSKGQGAGARRGGADRPQAQLRKEQRQLEFKPVHRKHRLVCKRNGHRCCTVGKLPQCARPHVSGWRGPSGRIAVRQRSAPDAAWRARGLQNGQVQRHRCNTPETEQQLPIRVLSCSASLAFRRQAHARVAGCGST